MRSYILNIYTALSITFCLSAALNDENPFKHTLKEKIQQIMDHATKKTGYGFTFAYIDAQGREFAIGSGKKTYANQMPIQVPGNMTGDDVLILGSGTKAFVSTAVMRLVDQGKVNLDDPANIHIDIALKNQWNSSMEELFGPWALNVTVRRLVYMQSGIQDFEIGTRDEELLRHDAARQVHDPYETLKFVADQKKPSPCDTKDCTWFFEPGTHTSYSSTNYVLLGLLLVAHAPEGQQTWQTMDLGYMAGLNKTDYPNTFFPTYGVTHDIGLTVPGLSLYKGEAEIWEQDYSIMGFTAGNAMASARDVAKFYWDLFGPNHKLVSDERIAEMTNFTNFDKGWADGIFAYGAGLIVSTAAAKHIRLPPLSDPATMIGHAGHTYGFQSAQGWFPHLNASMSLITNQDSDWRYPMFLMCPIVEAVMHDLGFREKLGCWKYPIQPIRWRCHKIGDNAFCKQQQFPWKHGTDLDDCLANCSMDNYTEASDFEAFLAA